MPESSSHSKPYILKLFEAYGVEIEYMIVDRNTLEILPFADILLTGDDGIALNDVIREDITWCNELSMHLIEFNFTRPEKTLTAKSELFHKNILHANSILANHNAMLLPSGMHPFLDPETLPVKLWPFELADIYSAYDKIFNCKNHGWINVQSAHLNLPFSSDEEFMKLHSAIRFILPIIPALAASSPILEGKITGEKDSRLDHYKHNQKMVPEIGADIIPEIIKTREEYKIQILDKMYKAISPYDPEGVLQDEWLNSRGAIARFDRSAIEIRVIDTQECATADFAVIETISRLVKWLIEEKFDQFNAYHNFNQSQLIHIFNDCIRNGDEALIENSDYLKIFGLDAPVSGKTLWSHLFKKLFKESEKKNYHAFLQEYQKNGTLASRILKAAGNNPDEAIIKKTYQKLARCLAENSVFTEH